MIKINKKEQKNDWILAKSPLSQMTLEVPLLISKDKSHCSKKTVTHFHSWVQFIYTRIGTVYVEVDGKFRHLPALHGVWIPKNMEHTFWSSENAEYIAVNLDQGLINNFGEISCKIVEITPLVDYYTSYLMDNQLMNVLTVKGQAYLQLLLELIEVDFTLPYPTSQEFILLCREIQATPSLLHSPDECAEKLNMSQSTFIRRFKKETGITYQEWRQRMRLLQSIERIKQGDNILNIALDIGYSSASSYIYAFKKNFGVPPTKYK